MSKNEIVEKFNILKENYRISNIIEFYNFLKTKTPQEILSNAEFIIQEQSRGGVILLDAIKNIPAGNLSLMEEAYNKKIVPYMMNATKSSKIDINHVEKVNECAVLIKEKIDKFDFKKDTIEILNENFNKVESIFESKISEDSVEEFHIGTMAPVVTGNEYKKYKRKKLQNEFDVNFVDTFMDSDNEVSIEAFNNLLRIATVYQNYLDESEVLEEGITQMAKKAAIRADSAARKSATNIKKAMDKSKSVKNIAKRVPEHFDKLANNTLGAISKMDKAERRKRIIEGGFRFKLIKIIKNTLIHGVAFAIHPALAAITILGQLGFDHQLDNKERREILKDLELELKMCREKIKDAESSGDKKEKYQLMRIESALERNIERIRLRLDTVNVTPKGKVKV